MIDGKMTLCNTKETRDQLRKHKARMCHETTAVGGRNTRDKTPVAGCGTSLEDRYRIPESLIFSLFFE